MILVNELFLFFLNSYFGIKIFNIMNLHEYQGKLILSEHGVNVQRGYIAQNACEAASQAKKLQIRKQKHHFLL